MSPAFIQLFTLFHFLTPDPSVMMPVAPAILADGVAQAPSDAPAEVRRMVEAANEIAGRPYKAGGGHENFVDSGYDCSGTVSYVLAGAGLLEYPLSSGDFLDWGEPGVGKWVTIYARRGHVFMVIAGVRFDTTDSLNVGPGWRVSKRPPEGFVPRHPAGL